MFQSLRFTLLAALTALIFRCPAFAEQATQPMPDSQVVISGDPKLFALTGNGASKADANIVDVAE